MQTQHSKRTCRKITQVPGNGGGQIILIKTSVARQVMPQLQGKKLLVQDYFLHVANNMKINTNRYNTFPISIELGCLYSWRFVVAGIPISADLIYHCILLVNLKGQCSALLVNYRDDIERPAAISMYALPKN